MATNAQNFANRENSQKSTGPRTPEGKHASSRNAVSHGLSAADPVLPHEDRDQFNALLAQYKADFSPATAHEEFLVAQMAGARWKLDRAERIEIIMLSGLGNPASVEDIPDNLIARAMMDQTDGGGLLRLDRYRASLERTYLRCSRELRAARKEQKEANAGQMAEKKFLSLFGEYLAAAPPGYELRPQLIRIEQNEPKPAGISVCCQTTSPPLER